MGKLVLLKNETRKGISDFDHPQDDSFESLLKKAHILKTNLENSDSCIVMVASPQKYFEEILMKELIERKAISREFFLCAVYIFFVMEKLVYEKPEHWHVFEYLIEVEKQANSKQLKNGADFCFSLCSFFPKKTERRAMKKSDYISFGQAMYWQHYLQSGSEVACYMSESFEEMSQLSSECFPF